MMFASNNFKNQCCLIVMEFSIMFYRRITLALALLLTIFAFEAKADYTPSSKCMDLGHGPFDLEFTCGTASCHYIVSYCYKCPNPALGEQFQLYIGQIRQDPSYSPCPAPPTASALFACAEAALTQWSFISGLCGFANIPPCIPTPQVYFQIIWPQCWKVKMVSGNLVFDICSPYCSAICINTYKLCYYDGNIYSGYVGRTTGGDFLMCFACNAYDITDLESGAITYGPNETYSPCFKVCW